MRRVALLLAVLPFAAHASDGTPSPLLIGPADVRIEQSVEGGYYLYVRAVEGLGSVLLTESTEASDHSAATYAYRNPVWHPENGDEKRMLDGAFLETPGLYSLIDSTPSDDALFGRAFRIFIPWVVTYGYPWTRNGELLVVDGTYLSIRAFERPYADYRGAHRDNPFILRVTQRPPASDLTRHMPQAVEEFRGIAVRGLGQAFEVSGPEEAVATIGRILRDTPGESLDLVVALDTTESMRDDMPYLREALVPMLREVIGEVRELRVGIVLYRDYMEEYLTRRIEFSTDLAAVQRAVDGVRVAGGRDLPEAVHEALYVALTGFSWRAAERMVILVGDAPPHPRPRGSVTADMVHDEALALGVRIHTILLPF